jgi:mannose-6-phosphate isomerase-like protein (cupin superfamily)
MWTTSKGARRRAGRPRQERPAQAASQITVTGGASSTRTQTNCSPTFSVRFKVAASTMVIKVDQRKGGSPNFFMATEGILPGDAIAPHLHPEYDEILFVHRGTGLATLGAREATVTEGATLYIPSNTRVSLKNTGKERSASCSSSHGLRWSPRTTVS